MQPIIRYLPTLLAIMGLGWGLWAPLAQASTSSNMNGFFSSAVGSAVVSGPTAYQGQSRNYYTMGNLSFRTPQKNLQLANLQLPSIKAGCGGIDLFTGGFSFVNAGALVAELKAIAGNAEGYAFNYALKHLCPSCADILNEMQDWAQKINAMNINSCQTATLAVDSVFGALQSDNSQLCQDLGVQHGTFSDQAAAWAGCETNPVEQVNADPEGSQLSQSQSNLAWNAIQKVGLISGDNDLAQALMSMTGTVVKNCTTSADQGCTYSYFPPTAADPATVKILLDGGSFAALACDEFSKCLNPVAGGTTITITQGAAFKAQVTTLVDGIVANVINRTPLTAQQQNFLQATPVPVMRMARTYVAAEGALAQNDLDNYADLIAEMVAYEFLADSISSVQAGLGNISNVSRTEQNAWLDRMQALKTQIVSLEHEAAVQDASFTQMIDRAQAMDAQLAGAYGSRLGAAYAYAAR